jgi:hypothetical protein
VRVVCAACARRRRKLPERYASEFLRRAKRGWFSDSIGWEEFAALMHERESFTLRAYNSLQLNRSGHLATPAITSSLRRLGLPATEENASAMLRYLGRAQDGYISYGEFRNFLLLLPPEQVRETDPSVLWFEAATFVQLRAPAVAAGASGVALLKAALAGALASGTSTAFMHPLDTLKTRVQASVGRAPGLRGLGRMIPELGPRRLYLGIIPAVTGAATSHGIRTASYEWARVALAPLLALGLPGVSDTAIQGIASGFGTFLGTGVRIPNEVLKQRLQTGQHAHVLEAARAVIRGGGVAALFAGTTATLAREVPFYVLGMVAYERLKAMARGVTGRELSPWQTIAVGALSGAVAAVATTPADVLKTRIMTGRAPAGLGALALAQRMVAEEGIASLYKGAAPRALWIAPLGAMNFAGCARARSARGGASHPAAAPLRAFRSLTRVLRRACFPGVRRYELAKKALSAVPEPEVTPTPTSPAPEPAAAVTAKARSLDLAHSVTAAGAKAGTRLREAVASLTDSKGAALRRASEAAVASVAASASAAAPHIRQAAEKGAGLLQKKSASSAVTSAAAAVAAPVAVAPVLPAAPLETSDAGPRAAAVAAAPKELAEPADVDDSVAADAVQTAATLPFAAADGNASKPAEADVALPAASNTGATEPRAGGGCAGGSLSGGGSSDGAGGDSGATQVAGGDGGSSDGGGSGRCGEDGPAAEEPPPRV